MPLIDVRVVDDAHIVGVWGTTFIQIWRGTPTGEASAEVNRLAREFIKSSHVQTTSLFVVERGSPPPDDVTRKNFAAFSRDISADMAMSVVVAEGGGFRAALVRAVGVTLTTLMPHSSKFKFVNDLNQAVRLIGPHLLPGSGGPDALIMATEELRKKLPGGSR